MPQSLAVQHAAHKVYLPLRIDSSKEQQTMADPSKKDAQRVEREQAWIGDAVLGLFARSWIMQHEGKMDAEMFKRMSSNHFLSALGNPTAVEAKIGRCYQADGIDAAFLLIETEIIPLFLLQEKRRIRQSGGRK